MKLSQNSAFVSELLADPALKDFVASSYTPVSLAVALTKESRAGAERSIEASSIVFAHSILDATALDYCETVSILKPESWADRVSSRQFALNDIKTASYGELLQRAIKKSLEEFDKKSLLQKIGLLFALCRPDPAWQPMSDYKYSSEWIKKFDKLRHEIVHGDAAEAALPAMERDIWLAQKTCAYMMALLAHSFGFRIDPANWSDPALHCTDRVSD